METATKSASKKLMSFRKTVIEDTSKDPKTARNNQEKSPQKCGVVALMGLPNAGKSTLLNTLLDHPVAITSHTSGTTRFPLRGACVFENTQLVLIDTPGLFEKARSTLEKAMLRAAEGAPIEADLWLLVIDVTKGKKQLEHILSHFSQKNRPPLWIVLNKIDQVQKPALLNWADTYQKVSDRLFMVSALEKDGTQDLLTALLKAMPKGPWIFAQDVVTNIDKSLMLAEMTREALLHTLKEEVPHKLYVETEKIERAPRKTLKVNQVIHVSAASHKSIILGKGGKTIKMLGQQARRRMENFFQHPVHLFLYVRHTPLWMEKASFYKMVGLEITRK